MSTDPASVADYKVFLRDCLNRRPSGLRKKLALALQKNKSFITQITSPAYSVPIPAGDLSTIFEICHLSPEEQTHFIALYEAAHAGRANSVQRQQFKSANTSLHIALPQFSSEATAREVEIAIREAATNIIRVAQQAENRDQEAISKSDNEEIS